jgi:tetratricopeptide (TPR) repeat protein
MDSAGISPPHKVRNIRPWVVVILLLIVALSGGVGIYLLKRSPIPQLPTIDLSLLDPAIVKAITEVRERARQAPRSAAAWGELGKVLVAHDLRGDANRCFAQAELLDPQNPLWPYYQGVALSLGDPEASLPKLRRAVELNGEIPDAPRLWLSEVLFGQGYLDEAEASFRRVLDNDTKNPRAHLGLGRLAYARGNLPDALTHAAIAAADPRKRQAARAFMAQVYQRLGNVAMATKVFRLAAELPPDLPWPDPYVEEIDSLRTGARAQVQYAEKKLAQGRADEAIRLLERTVQDHPDTEWGWFVLGKAFLPGKDYIAAERALRRAIAIAPGLAEAHYFLGFALFQQGDYQGAAAAFRGAIELKADYASAFFNLGQSMLKLQERKGAMDAFRSAARIKPDFVQAHTELADLLFRSRRDAEAASHLRYALEGDDPRAALLLAKVICRYVVPPNPVFAFTFVLAQAAD